MSDTISPTSRPAPAKAKRKLPTKARRAEVAALEAAGSQKPKLRHTGARAEARHKIVQADADAAASRAQLIADGHYPDPKQWDHLNAEIIARRGRPTNYRPEMCETVIELGSQGKSVAGIAAALGTDPSVLSRWSDAHPEFHTALTIARTRARAWFEDLAIRNIVLPKGITFNAHVLTKLMSAMFPDVYSDRAGQPLFGQAVVITVDQDEAKRVIALALARVMGGTGRSAPEDATVIEGEVEAA